MQTHCNIMTSTWIIPNEELQRPFASDFRFTHYFRIYSKIVVDEPHYSIGKNIAGDMSATLSPKGSFVTVVGCS